MCVFSHTSLQRRIFQKSFSIVPYLSITSEICVKVSHPTPKLQVMWFSSFSRKVRMCSFPQFSTNRKSIKSGLPSVPTHYYSYIIIPLNVEFLKTHCIKFRPHRRRVSWDRLSIENIPNANLSHKIHNLFGLRLIYRGYHGNHNSD